MKNLLIVLFTLSLIGCSRENTNSQEAAITAERAASQAEEQQRQQSDALKPNFTKQSKANTTSELGK